MYRIFALTALLLSLLAASGRSGAAILFSDAFDDDRDTSMMNIGELLNWTVSDGAVDYIRSGEYFITCAGGAGGCIDMDGSIRDAGRITSKRTFTFDPGIQYFIEVALSGSQRAMYSRESDSVAIGIVRDSDSVRIETTLGPLAPDAPFETLGTSFSGLDAPGSWRLFAEGFGSHNVGAVLDDYVLRSQSRLISTFAFPTPSPQSSVPGPLSLALLGIGLLAMRLTRRG